MSQVFTVMSHRQGKPIKTLRGPTGWVNAVAVTPNGRHVISGSSDRTFGGFKLRHPMFHAEAARLDAYLRSVPELLSRSGKKLRRAMKDNTLASVALHRLLETGQVIELKYKKQRLCLHSAHIPQKSARVRHSQETSPDVDHDLSLQEVHQAYDRVRVRQLGSAVFISDLATELQIGSLKLHEWIRSEVIESGHGSLDEGHWPTATERQRAAAIEHVGSRRLLIRF